MKRLLILIFILFMAGCVSSFNVEKANTYLSSHPDRPADIKEAISIGKVVTGMNEEEVSICMGKPGTISTTQAYPSNTKTTVWGYFNGGPSKRVFILFKDGTVTGINEISQTGMIMVQPSAPIISGPVMTPVRNPNVIVYPGPVTVGPPVVKKKCSK